MKHTRFITAASYCPAHHRACLGRRVRRSWWNADDQHRRHRGRNQSRTGHRRSPKSVAATIKGQDNKGNFLVQHYWVTSSGEMIRLKEAVLTPVATSDPNVVAELWGNYSSDILGGTSKFANAIGRINYFGIGDFKEMTLVLRVPRKGLSLKTAPTRAARQLENGALRPTNVGIGIVRPDQSKTDWRQLCTNR